MTDNSPSAIDVLRDASSRLNAASDRAAATVLAAERFLNDDCKAGVTALVLVSSYYEEEHGIEFGTYLSYERIGGRFRIAVGSLMDGIPQDDAKPWSDCAREQKLETIAKLPALLSAVAEAVLAQVAAADRASTAADNMLAELGADEKEA